MNSAFATLDLSDTESDNGEHEFPERPLPVALKAMVLHGEMNVVLPESTLKDAEEGAPVRRPLSLLGATRPGVDLVRGTDVGEEGRQPLDNHQEARAEKGGAFCRFAAAQRTCC